ncbi:hypothetical protein JW835_15480 [bacterium]|nr:hypothetical protein [bacterium]
MIRFCILIVFFCFSLIPVQAGIHVWFPDTLVCHETEIQLPVYVSFVQAADSVVAYECEIEYDPAYLSLLDIHETGSMVQSWGSPFLHLQTGQCRIAGFTSNHVGQQLTDTTHTWLFFHFWVDSDTSSMTEVRINHFHMYSLSGEMMIDSLKNGQLDIVVNFPPRVDPFPGVNILEDDSVSVPLTDYVHDPNDPWLSLDINFQPVSSLMIRLDTTGVLTIKPEPDWSGFASVPFQVTDRMGEKASGNIDVQVVPVPDPPTPFSLISPENDTVFFPDTQVYQFQWQPSENRDPGDQVRYRFFLSEDSLFQSSETLRFSNLNTPEISLNQGFAAGTYFWSIMAEDQEGFRQWCDSSYRFSVQAVSGFQHRQTGRFQMDQNAPNPFNQTTTVSFTLNRTGQTTLNIVDIRGIRVRALMHRMLAPGEYHVSWDGSNDRGQEVSSGIYWAVLKASDQIETIKICVVK